MKAAKEREADGKEHQRMHDRMLAYVRGSAVLGEYVPRLDAVKPTPGVLGKLKVKPPAKPSPAKHAQINKLLPKLKDCRGEMLSFKNAYIAYYPGVVPASRTRTWGDCFSKQACKFAVCRWAWSHHTKITGEVCPHDISHAAA